MEASTPRSHDMIHDIPIALVSNRSEFLPSVVALHSLLSHQGAKTSYQIHLFTDFVLGPEQCYLDRLRKQFPGCSLETHYERRLQDDHLSHNGQRNERSESGTALIKYHLAELLPDVEKLLYIAGDSLIQKDLTELFAVDLQDNYLAAAKAEIKYRDTFHLDKYGEKVGVPLEDYVDVGVMLLNLTAMRRDGLATRLSTFDQTHPHLLFEGQDAFNAVCSGRIVELPRRYNLTSECLEIPSIRKHALCPEDAVILRFTGKAKPWRTMRADWSERYLSQLLKSPARMLTWNLIASQGKGIVKSIAVTPVRTLRKKIARELSRNDKRKLRVRQEELQADLHAFSMQQLLLSQVISGSEMGINDIVRTPRIIVSLTTVAARLPEIATTIESLLRQTIKPDAIILWVDEDRVSEETLPILLKKQRARGLTIRFCTDIGPHTKLVPALKEYPNDIIITVDDDILYRMDLVERLMAEYTKDPNMIYCNEARFISLSRGREFSYSSDWRRIHSEVQGLNVLPLGVGGVLYPPKILGDQVFDLKLQQELTPKADDIWFKAMSLKQRVICKRISGPRRPAPMRPFSQEVALHKTNVKEGGNERQIQTCFDHFELWPVLGIET